MDPTKLSLHFSEFSTIFYVFYMFQKIGNTIEVPTLRTDPWKDSAPYNVALGHGRRRGRPNSGDSGEGIGREIVGRGARAHLGLICAGVGCREAGGERGRRRGPVAAAAASIPARRSEVPSNARCFELLWGLCEVLGRSSGWGIEQGRELARQRSWRPDGAARPWHCRPFL
jgi:hypothetical protein